MKYLLTLREFSWRVAKSPTLIVGPLFPICDACYRLTLRQGQADILFGMAGSCAEGHESLGKAFSGGEGGILPYPLNRLLMGIRSPFATKCQPVYFIRLRAQQTQLVASLRSGTEFVKSGVFSSKSSKLCSLPHCGSLRFVTRRASRIAAHAALFP